MIEVQNLTSISLSPETLSLIERILRFSMEDTYELSVVFCDNKKSRALNREHRGKDYPTNILSFPLSKDSGEIFIDLEKCLSEHESFNREFENFVLFLFIHGIVHLKGYEHGSRMEELEKEIRKNFDI